MYIFCMYEDLPFVWNPQKNLLNQSKHEGIDFEEAKIRFYDEFACIVFDPLHIFR